MHAQIEVLASLQIVDREIRAQAIRKQQALAEIQEKEMAIKAKKQELRDLTGVFDEKEKLRGEKDRVLQDDGKKAMDKRMRMNRIKNVKELQALQREIDQIRQSNSELEEELIKMMEELEGLKNDIKAKQEELTKAEEEWHEKQRGLQSQVSNIDAAVADASTRRKNIATQIASDLMSRYELIFARRGGTAVVDVTGGICQGCYMNIPPQMWNEIIRSDKVILCPSCQRILHYKPAEVEEKSA